MNHKAAQSIDEYFEGSWNDFEAAIKKHFRFDHIDGISRTLSSNIYYWYNMEKEQWRDVLAELTFIRDAKEVGDSNSPFTNANIAITGKISKLDRETLGELLTAMGAYVDDRINPNTNYLIVGDNPNGEMIVQALTNNVELLVENTFMEMLGCQNVS